MHDDTVASSYGFSGGLVPGVDVHAYLCHLPAARWGMDWVRSGTISSRFVAPVYDGDDVTVDADERPDGSLDLSVHVGERLCATATAGPPGSASLTDGPGPTGEPIGTAPVPELSARPLASAETLAPGTLLATLEVGFRADKSGEYLDDISEDLPVFRTGAAAQPGWLLRQANYVLAATVRLGPWIHVSSACRHLDAVGDGERISTRARVAGLAERKGHRFVELDVDWVAGTATDERLVMRARHVAIYEPRRR